MTTWTREPRDDEELCEWTNHKRGERRGHILHRLSESKYSSLAFEWYHFLQDRLFTCLGNRRDKHECKKPKTHEPYRWNGREYDTCCPHDEIHEEKGFDRIFTESVFGDEHTSGDESSTCDGEDNSPDLDWDHREPVRVHERHEHSSDEIVEHGEEYHGKKSWNPCDNPYSSTDIDILVLWFVALEVFLTGKCEGEEMDDDEECDREHDADRPGHTELSDDDTREYGYHTEGQSIHRTDLPVRFISFSLWDEYRHECRERYHTDIAHEDSEHRHQDKNPEPGIPHIGPSWPRKY